MQPADPSIRIDCDSYVRNRPAGRSEPLGLVKLVDRVGPEAGAGDERRPRDLGRIKAAIQGGYGGRSGTLRRFDRLFRIGGRHAWKGGKGYNIYQYISIYRPCTSRSWRVGALAHEALRVIPLEVQSVNLP